jgi:rhodanese-related sulfurtransferase
MSTLPHEPITANPKLPATLPPEELYRRLLAGERLQLLDVREPAEFAGVRIGLADLVPLGELARRAGELERDRPIVCVCRSGQRAAQAAEKLAALGFPAVTRLEGGLLAWERAKLPVERDARAPWALERQVRLVAGLLVLTGLVGSLFWPPAVGLAWLVGAGLTVAALTDWCGMALLLAKAPWNQAQRGCSLR